MLRIAVQMLRGDRAKYLGLLFGITFTSFLVTYAGSYLCGFMTRGFAIIAENPSADVWVMDPAVESTQLTTDIPDSALSRVRSVDGVLSATPLVVASVDARFANGRFQAFQLIGVDDATLSGLPPLEGGVSPSVMRSPDAIAIDSGGTEGKLETPSKPADQWPYGRPHLKVPTRELAPEDSLLADDHRLIVRARARAFPRYPPQPLMYTTLSNAARILPQRPHLLTFVLARAATGIAPSALATRIQAQTGLRARSADDFKADTVRWLLSNSEDVGDITSMVSIALLVGLGMTGVLLYMFTTDNLRQFAVLKALGADSQLLLTMVFVQTGVCALLGIGLGLGVCAVVGKIVILKFNFPFRMMWFTPLVAAFTVVLVSVTAAAISARPVLKLEPGVVFAGR